MDIISKYEKMCLKSVKLNEGGCKEESHIYQDKIYRTFIKDISNGKFKSLKIVEHVANMLKKDVVKYDKEDNRWYA